MYAVGLQPTLLEAYNTASAGITVGYRPTVIPAEADLTGGHWCIGRRDPQTITSVEGPIP